MLICSHCDLHKYRVVSLNRTPSRAVHAHVHSVSLMFSSLLSAFALSNRGSDGTKKVRGTSTATDAGCWPSGCVDLINSTQSTRYALKMHRARSYFRIFSKSICKRHEFPVYI